MAKTNTNSVPALAYKLGKLLVELQHRAEVIWCADEEEENESEASDQVCLESLQLAIERLEDTAKELAARIGPGRFAGEMDRFVEKLKGFWQHYPSRPWFNTQFLDDDSLLQTA